MMYSESHKGKRMDNEQNSAVENKKVASGVAEGDSPRQEISSQPVVLSNVSQQQDIAPMGAASVGVLILQWLTYAFWGWTLLALWMLTQLTLSYFISGRSESDEFGDSGIIAYSLAALIVLFIISIICDIFYRKFEPEVKKGASMVIMLLHTVLFALCGVGFVIGAVFVGISMVISTGDGSGKLPMLITAIIMAILYGATLLRVIRPRAIKHIVALYWVVMTLVVISMTVLGIFGPTVATQMTKNDRLIESNLATVSQGINEYVREEERLPQDLSQVKNGLASYDDGAKTLIESGLVRYTQKGRVGVTDELLNTLGVADERTALEQGDVIPAFQYELCVTYKKADSGGVRGSGMEDEMSTYPETTGHPAGDVCYTLRTSGY